MLTCNEIKSNNFLKPNFDEFLGIYYFSNFSSVLTCYFLATNFNFFNCKMCKFYK